jgi:hypothetical protein
MKSFAILVSALISANWVFAQSPAVSPAPPLPLSSVAKASEAEAWQAIFSVIQHPRCMNCHTVTEYPRQGDLRLRHQQWVIRGAKNQGATTLPCAACHQSSNTADGRVPGAPAWHLAPLSMGWENLNSSQLCAAIKDKKKNGDRDLASLEKHMTSDPLVQWAWSPGARQAPALAQRAFHEAVRRWVAGGAICPS